MLGSDSAFNPSGNQDELTPIKGAIFVAVVVVAKDFALRLRGIVKASAALPLLVESTIIKAPSLFGFLTCFFNPTVKVAKFNLSRNRQGVKFFKELNPIASCLNLVKTLKIVVHIGYPRKEVVVFAYNITKYLMLVNRYLKNNSIFLIEVVVVVDGIIHH